MPQYSVEDYHVGWVCALSKELTAARAMLDEIHEDVATRQGGDNNSYVLGRICGHNVVIACLPAGLYGTNSAATVATNMLRTFTSIQFGLMVGIGGGIPNLDRGWDIRLGDVVVSHPEGSHSGVVQYDLRKNLGEHKFELKGFLHPPPIALLTALSTLQSRHAIDGSHISDILSEILSRKPRLARSGYLHPGVEKDVLHCSNLQSHQVCEGCDQSEAGIIHRDARDDQDPVVHYGTIASGNELIRNAVERDRLGQELGAKCIEMEAAGLMNNFPCIVIRGVCDYADSFKNDIWQEYAAITAAAFAKELLSEFKPTATFAKKQSSDMSKYDLGLHLFDAPYLPDGLFAGRELEVKEMKKILEIQSLANDPTRKVLVLGGMGGMGKTQLAIAYARECHSLYSSVWWLDASSQLSVVNSLRSVASRIADPNAVADFEASQVTRCVSDWLSERHNTRWLLIFDNYDDPDLYNIEKYYPSATRGSIIVTTRQPRRVNGTSLKVESVKKLEDAMKILAARSGRKRAESDPTARRLVERLDGYPLAIATAGAFLKESTTSYSEYLQQYESNWKTLDPGETLPDYPARTLFTTWNLSYKQIHRKDPRAAQLLKFLAFIDYRNIWYDLFQEEGVESSQNKESAWSRFRRNRKEKQQGNHPTWFAESLGNKFSFDERMRVLKRYCLVEANHESKSYSLHVCVHDWISNILNHQVDGALYRLAIQCVAAKLPVSEWYNFESSIFNKYVPHATRLAHTRYLDELERTPMTVDTAEQMYKISELLYRKNNAPAAISILTILLPSDPQSWDPESGFTCRIGNSLGGMYYSVGELRKAEDILKELLEHYTPGSEDINRMRLHLSNNLANVYSDQGKLKKAYELYYETLLGYEELVGKDHLTTISTEYNLGELCHQLGDMEEAERRVNQALKDYERTVGLDHTATIGALMEMVSIYVSQGRSDDALRISQQAIAKLERTVGPNHPATLDVSFTLGGTYLKLKMLDEAERTLSQAIAKSGLNTQSQYALIAAINLAQVYEERHRLEEAAEMFENVLDMLKTASLLNSTNGLRASFNFGLLCIKQGKLQKAADLFQEVIDGGNAIRGGETPITIRAADQLRWCKERLDGWQDDADSQISSESKYG